MHAIEKYRDIQMPLLSYNWFAKYLVLLRCEFALFFTL